MWKITLVFMGALLLFGQNNQIKFEANAPSGVEVFSASGFKAGNAKYCYWIVTTFPIGNVISKPTCYNNVSIPSVASPITITWQGISEAISYTVLRTDTEWLPQGNNNIAVGTGALVWQTDVNVLGAYALNNVVGRVEANIQLDNKRANIPKVHISRPISTPGYEVSGVPLASNHLSDGANLEKISNKDQPGGYVGLDANGNARIGATLPDAALGGVLGGWNKYTVTFANAAFQAAATEVSIVLGEMPANGRIEELVVDHAAFAGTGITSFTCSLGDGTNHTIYAPALNLFAAAGTSVTHQDGGSFSALKAAHNLTLRCTANANVGDGAATVLTAGRLDIWLKVSVLQ